MKTKQLSQLLATFFKIGLVAFGGGYAVIPLLQREVVEAHGWITTEELTDFMGISQTLPGIIFVNSATMIGYRVGSFWGALTATIAGILPTFLLTLAITTFLWNFTDLILVKKAFTGILIGVAALIIYSLIKTWKVAVKTWFDLSVVILASVLLIFFKINVVLIILGAAMAGYCFNLALAKGRGVK